VTAHVERPTRLAGGKTYCACGQPWPCASAPGDDRVASTLDEIRVRVFVGNNDDAPVLLAAVEAVLKVADEWEQDRYKGTSTLEWIHQRCAERLREAITRELTGKEAGDHG
jgi:hypothetical protein